jgi:hypothetical protein
MGEVPACTRNGRRAVGAEFAFYGLNVIVLSIKLFT